MADGHRRHRAFSRHRGGGRHLRRRACGIWLLAARGQPPAGGARGAPGRSPGRTQRATLSPDRRRRLYYEHGRGILAACATPKLRCRRAARQPAGFSRSARRWSLAGAGSHRCWPNSPQGIPGLEAHLVLSDAGLEVGRTRSTSLCASTAPTIRRSSREKSRRPGACSAPRRPIWRRIERRKGPPISRATNACGLPAAIGCTIAGAFRTESGVEEIKVGGSSIQQQRRRAPRLGARRQGSFAGGVLGRRRGSAGWTPCRMPRRLPVRRHRALRHIPAGPADAAPNSAVRGLHGGGATELKSPEASGGRCAPPAKTWLKRLGAEGFPIGPPVRRV